MSEAQHTSQPGVGESSTTVDYKPCPSNIARRSISIFSRRGTDTPEEAATSINQAAMSRSPTKKMTDRQQSWLQRRGLDVRASKDFPKGTILKAVPPAEKLRMTQLEKEMATSPNEEIMSAISERNTIQPMWAALSEHSAQSPHSPSTPLQSNVDWQQDSVHRTDSAKRRETNTRIGIWVNGVTHWDEQPAESTWPQGTRTNESVRSTLQSGYPSVKPTLTVSIPHTGPWAGSMSESTHVISSLQPLVPPQDLTSQTADSATPRITVAEAKSNSISHPTGQPSTFDERLSNGLQPDVRRSSSSTSSSTIQKSDASMHSKRSSTTSVDPIQSDDEFQRQRQFSQAACSETSDAQCNSSDEVLFYSGADTNKPLPRVPFPRNMRAAPAPPPSPTSNVVSLTMRSTSAPGIRRANRVSSAPRPSTGGVRSHSLCDLDVIDAEFMRASPYTPSMSDRLSEAESPTLSQAEHDLQAQLGTISEVVKDDDPAANNVFYDSLEQQAGLAITEHVKDAHSTNETSLQHSDSVRSVMQPPARAPTLPKRSRKREWRNSYQVENVLPNAMRPPPKAPGRRKSDSALNASEPANQQRSVETDSVHRSESAKVPHGSRSYERRRSRVYAPSFQVVEPVTAVLPTTLENQPAGYQDDSSHDLPAERVLLQILSTLTSMDDLFNMSIINKGMYRVFKENELHLTRTVAQNQSPAGWELREWRIPGSDEDLEASSKVVSQLEHTPRSYVRSYKTDDAVIAELKKLVLDHCQTFLRRETALAFDHPGHPDAQRFTDAFSRIWTFCTIFGSKKGREEDVTGQLDWLKGGLLANNQSFSATVNTNLDFDMGSVLLNAPEHFAQGNKGGLSAAQLYDMTELWNCLGALLAGYQNHVEEARSYGVFAQCNVREGDIETEEQMLEEWIFYVMTLGPQVLLDLARHAIDNPTAGFSLAKCKGWTNWSPSVTGSRASFLREPVARLYEERISAAASKLQNPQDLEKKETARKRVAALAAEIRLKRQTSGYKRLPMIDMRNERAMSMISRHSSVIPSRPPPHMLQTSNLPPTAIYHAYSTRSAKPLSHPDLVSPLSLNHHTPPHASSARPSSPSTQNQEAWSIGSRQISPIIEDRVEAFNRLSLANLDGMAESTVERAVRKITDMGFSEAQAKRALRMTDMGDGLRVDRAVDLLLRH